MSRLRFHGFSPGLFRFLVNLSHNNTKDWFDRNRRYYEANVLTPIKAFAGDIGAVLCLLNPELETIPLVGKTISRINNDLRFHRDRPPYRPFVYISFPRQGSRWSSEAVLYVALYGRGVAAGFYPGGYHPLRTGPIQDGIKNNLRLFQKYLDERRIPNRYSELAGGENGRVTRWPLPKTARRWVSLESFTVGEYFDHSDPILYSEGLRDRVIGILLDLYPLWLFAMSDKLKEDFELYRENARLLERQPSAAAD